MADDSIANVLIQAAHQLARASDQIQFKSPVAHIYNPLTYAWAGHQAYLRAFARAPKRVLFLGMNPGPFGMVQTGIPFGEVAAVRDWMKISAPIKAPPHAHPRRPVLGFACTRSEVSGRRLWGLFAERFDLPDNFFADHFVANYCPLAFMDANGRNLTPDKFPASDMARLYAACDEHLRAMIVALEPEWVIGIGDFAEKRARLALEGQTVKFGRILHPSPASPAANRGWSIAATRQLQEMKVWS